MSCQVLSLSSVLVVLIQSGHWSHFHRTAKSQHLGWERVPLGRQPKRLAGKVSAQEKVGREKREASVVNRVCPAQLSSEKNANWARHGHLRRMNLPLSSTPLPLPQPLAWGLGVPRKGFERKLPYKKIFHIYSQLAQLMKAGSKRSTEL